MRVPLSLLMPVLLPLLLGTSTARAASYKEGDVVKVIANNVRAAAMAASVRAEECGAGGTWGAHPPCLAPHAAHVYPCTSDA
jgi:hypothetical protein